MSMRGHSHPWELEEKRGLGSPGFRSLSSELDVREFCPKNTGSTGLLYSRSSSVYVGRKNSLVMRGMATCPGHSLCLSFPHV